MGRETRAAIQLTRLSAGLFLPGCKCRRDKALGANCPTTRKLFSRLNGALTRPRTLDFGLYSNVREDQAKRIDQRVETVAHSRA